MADIVLGVTGSIAAYKACDLASTLRREGHEVHAVLTDSAQRIVTPVTFGTLTGNPVVTGMFHEYAGGAMPHISLADHCDLFLVAPATANALGKFAHGLADDALSTLALAVEAPRLAAPAMNPRMWANPAVKENVATLRHRGWILVGPDQGAMACQDTGVGRLADTPTIMAAVNRALGKE
jgi:phosphopantothenoylcysteine synthetase/decarboxylase